MSANIRRNSQKVMALAKKVSAVLQRALGEELTAVALFGSAARGTDRPGSDLDILVVLQNPSQAYAKRTRRLVPLLDEVRDSSEYRELEACGRPLEPSFLVLSLAEARSHPPIFLDMVDEAMVLYDPAGELQRELKAVRERLHTLGSRKKHLPDGSWYWVLKPDLKPGEVIEL